MVELKNCPFCGNDLNKQDIEDTIYPTNFDEELYQIVCEEAYGGCGASIIGTYDECINKWNTRHV